MKTDDLKRTVLYAEHVKHGARIVPFAGFEMPVQYATGIPAEHRAVREHAGMFDISHMGEFRVHGSDAENFVNFVITNDVMRLEVGQAQYTMMCNRDGGIIDDLLVYKFPDRFQLVVNAANINKDFEWLRGCADEWGSGVELTDDSDSIALIALQGPESEVILANIADHALSDLGYYKFFEGNVASVPCVVSRTGYTGEDGFELYCQTGDAASLWQALLEAGSDRGLIPAGLGARDSLRLEMGYALYGNDIDETTSPLEARLGWTVKLNKGDFIGRESLQIQKDSGVERKLCGFILQKRGFPRPGYSVICQGREVDKVRSGTVGPTLGEGIGTAYLPSAHIDPDTEIAIVIRGAEVPGRVSRMPFYSGGSLER